MKVVINGRYATTIARSPHNARSSVAGKILATTSNYDFARDFDRQTLVDVANFYDGKYPLVNIEAVR
jgi:hypothetical protein